MNLRDNAIGNWVDDQRARLKHWSKGPATPPRQRWKKPLAILKDMHEDSPMFFPVLAVLLVGVGMTIFVSMGGRLSFLPSLSTSHYASLGYAVSATPTPTATSPSEARESSAKVVAPSVIRGASPDVPVQATPDTARMLPNLGAGIPQADSAEFRDPNKLYNTTDPTGHLKDGLDVATEYALGDKVKWGFEYHNAYSIRIAIKGPLILPGKIPAIGSLLNKEGIYRISSASTTWREYLIEPCMYQGRAYSREERAALATSMQRYPMMLQMDRPGKVEIDYEITSINQITRKRERFHVHREWWSGPPPNPARR